MKWLDVLPRTVAEHQAAWERRHAVLRACEAGARQMDIAAIMGLSHSRVWQMVQKAQRERRLGKTPPIELFLKRKDHPPCLTNKQRAKLKAAEETIILW